MRWPTPHPLVTLPVSSGRLADERARRADRSLRTDRIPGECGGVRRCLTCGPAVGRNTPCKSVERYMINLLIRCKPSSSLLCSPPRRLPPPPRAIQARKAVSMFMTPTTNITCSVATIRSWCYGRCAIRNGTPTAMCCRRPAIRCSRCNQLPSHGHRRHRLPVRRHWINLRAHRYPWNRADGPAPVTT